MSFPLKFSSFLVHVLDCFLQQITLIALNRKIMYITQKKKICFNINILKYNEYIYENMENGENVPPIKH